MRKPGQGKSVLPVVRKLQPLLLLVQRILPFPDQEYSQNQPGCYRLLRMDQVLVLYNPAVYSTGDVIGTWVYRVGLLSAQYSLGAAVGLFQSVIAFFMIVLSYYLARRLANYRIF